MNIDVYDRFCYHFQIHLISPWNKLTESNIWKTKNQKKQTNKNETHLHSAYTTHYKIHFTSMCTMYIIYDIFDTEPNQPRNTMRNKSALPKRHRILEQANKLTTKILQHTIYRRSFIYLSIHSFIHSLTHTKTCFHRHYVLHTAKSVIFLSLRSALTELHWYNAIASKIVYGFITWTFTVKAIIFRDYSPSLMLMYV